MHFADWVAQQPRGTLAEISRVTRVSYMTLLAMKRGRPARGKNAKLVSDYTKGECSIADLCLPPERAISDESDDGDGAELTQGAA